MNVITMQGVFTIHIYIMTKRTIALILGILMMGVTALILWLGSAYFSQSVQTLKHGLAEVEVYEMDVVASARRQVPIYAVAREDNKIALTIDAAWGSDKTLQILDILEEKKVQTTWFLCGFWIEKYQNEVRLIAHKGHEIGNHTQTHPHMSKLSQEQMSKEVTKVEQDLLALTGKKTTLFRAPFGEYDDRVLNSVRALGYESIQWSVSTNDWVQGATTAQILERAQKQTQSGGIILCHNNAQTIVEYLPQLIDTLRDQGYEFVTVSQLLLDGNTTIDANGIQQKAS